MGRKWQILRGSPSPLCHLQEGGPALLLENMAMSLVWGLYFLMPGAQLLALLSKGLSGIAGTLVSTADS